ncbi:MAG: hypothetical protein AB1Z23_02460 [Eubacteriales bacterium]
MSFILRNRENKYLYVDMTKENKEKIGFTENINWAEKYDEEIACHVAEAYDCVIVPYETSYIS